MIEPPAGETAFYLGEDGVEILVERPVPAGRAGGDGRGGSRPGGHEPLPYPFPIILWKSFIQTPVVALVPIAFILHQHSAHVSPHIVKELFAQPDIGFPVAVIHKNMGKIAAVPSFSENTIPEFGVAAATSRSDVQSFIKPPCQIEDFPAKSHVGACSYVPGRNTVWQMIQEIAMVKGLWQIAL